MSHSLQGSSLTGEQIRFIYWDTSDQWDSVYHGVALATSSWYNVGAHLAGVLILYFDKHIAHVCH